METLKITNLNLHAADPHNNSFNFKKFYEQIYECECSSFAFEEYFDVSLVQYCFENLSFVYHSGFNMFLSALDQKLDYSNILNFIDTKKKPNFYFFHKDCIINISIVDKDERENYSEGDDNDHYYNLPQRYKNAFDKEKENLTKSIKSTNSKVSVIVHYPSYEFIKDYDEKFSFLKKFVIESKKTDKISILMKDTYGEYDFVPLNINVPDIDVDLNYGEKFKSVYEKIVQKLSDSNKGLYMFHGEPGTGKSSFVKYLTTVVDKEFIFVPTNFLEKFVCDPDIFSILTKKKKCVLILEDAEKVLVSRDKGDNEYISTILNLSDGILSDMLQVSVIITYNCDEAKIDKALKRKGRTIIDYKFDKLSMDECKKLAKKLKFKKEQMESIKEPMNLSQLYNISDENKMYEEEEKSDRIIGFGKA
jgi:hypothetical protein